jgi:hypothetical protein
VCKHFNIIYIIIIMSANNKKATTDTAKSTSKSPAKSIRNPYQKSLPFKHPVRQKIGKGHFGLQKQGDVIYTIRLKQNIRVAFAVRANNREKSSYIQHLVHLIRNDDASVAHLNILTVVPRRATDGSNQRLMDGNYPMRQFLEVLDENDSNDSASAETWGRAIAARITELNRTSIYPTMCVYGGDLTPATGPATIDTQLIDRDVVSLAMHLYQSSITDGSFFAWIAPPHPEDASDGASNGGLIPPVSADFFGLNEDPRSLFMGNN